ncbi:MAG: AmmeMemoRadiSam system protein A [Kiritimatiellia bacterium]|jgi:AmmeMemoRadiSam system protein A
MHEHRSGTWTPGLSAEEQATLFAIADDTLKWCVRGRPGRFDMTIYRLTPKLKTVLATFVTLKIHGELRGCIGSLEACEPLYLSVHNNAVNAALSDPRFSPLRQEELPDVRMNVSILSPLTAIAGPEEFQVGRHGIILSKGGRRSVFLPEVAIDQKWTREETLANLSLKAGLPPAAWRHGATFQVFESVVLSRESAGKP